jgi:hypothetical protein
VPIAFGVKALERTRAPVSARLSAIGGRVTPICGGVLDRFLAHH